MNEAADALAAGLIEIDRHHGWAAAAVDNPISGRNIGSLRKSAAPLPRSSSGPGHRPLTAETGVRLPYGVLRHFGQIREK